MRSVPALALLLCASAVHAQATRPTRVALIDTGVAQTAGLASVLDAPFDLRPIEDDAPLAPHGTLVASVIARNAQGAFRIVPYRIDSRCTSEGCDMPIARIAEAVREATSRGADIIQISSYGHLDADAVRAVVGAARAGVHVVLCAGNDGGPSFYSDLASLHPLIHVVGSLDADGRPSGFSSRGSGAILWRRGAGLLAQGPDGREQIVDGTSFAASVYTAELISQGVGSGSSKATTASDAHGASAAIAPVHVPQASAPDGARSRALPPDSP
jgi:hypothetical protein